MASAGQIFSPYRAIGICCDHVPLVSQSLGTDVFVVTAVGKAFHVYLVRLFVSYFLLSGITPIFKIPIQGDKLRLIFVGKDGCC